MTKLMESKIPELFSRGLDEEKAIEVGATHTDKIATIIFEAVSKCLSDIKSKEFPVAFTFEDLVGETLACAVVKYIPNEDTTQPGNWSYVWSFDKDIIPEGAHVVKITDTMTHQYYIATAGTRFHMAFEGANFIVELSNYFFKILSKYLEDNASKDEQNGVELDGVFQARVAVENGEVVKSIELIGETKAIIKSDADLEV